MPVSFQQFLTVEYYVLIINEYIYNNEVTENHTSCLLLNKEISCPMSTREDEIRFGGTFQNT